MSENTSQGQGQGTGNQGSQNQPQSQSGEFQQLGQQQQSQPWTGQQINDPERPHDNSGFRSPQFQQNYRNQNPHEYERTAAGEQPRDTSGEYVRADEVDRIIEERLAERDRKHAAETAKLRNQVPQLVVAQHGGGPGNDNHRPSWNLAEQEAARAGEDLPHWHDEDE